jgi:hypothetical protein
MTNFSFGEALKILFAVPSLKFKNLVWCRFLIICLFFLPHAVYALQPTAEGLLHYTLEVSFDIQASTINGRITIPVKKGQILNLDQGRLHLTHVSLNKENIEISHQNRTISILSSRDGTIEIRYEGIFKSPRDPYEIAGEEILTVIDNKEIFLTGIWYPKPDQLCDYHQRQKLLCHLLWFSQLPQLRI